MRLFPVICVLLSIHVYPLMFDLGFYDDFFLSQGIYDRLDREVVMAEASAMISYLFYQQDLQPGFFNEKEIIHLADFRHLLFLLHLFLLTGCLMFVMNWKFYAASLSTGVGFLLLLLVFLGILWATTFPSLFDWFHALYPNDYYLLDPSTDNLILLFPETFFSALIFRILLYTGVTTLVLFAVQRGAHVY